MLYLEIVQGWLRAGFFAGPLCLIGHPFCCDDVPQYCSRIVEVQRQDLYSIHDEKITKGSKALGKAELVRPSAQRGGVLSEFKYDVGIGIMSPAEASMGIRFSDTDTTSTSNHSAEIIASTDYQVTEIVPWSEQEVGSGQVRHTGDEKIIIETTLRAPNDDTTFVVDDDEPLVNTWMVGNKLFARLGELGIIDIQDTCAENQEHPKPMSNTKWHEFGPTSKLEFSSGEALELICKDGQYQLLYSPTEKCPVEGCRIGMGTFHGACVVANFVYMPDDLNGKGEPVPDGKPDALVSTNWLAKDYLGNDVLSLEEIEAAQQEGREPTKVPTDDTLDWAEMKFSAGKLTKISYKHDYALTPPVGSLFDGGRELTAICGSTTINPEGEEVSRIEVDSPIGPETEAFFDQVSKAFLEVSEPEEVSMVGGFEQLCDLNGDATCDELDTALFEDIRDTCSGDAEYRPRLDVDASGCIDSGDQALVLIQDTDLDGVPDSGDNCLATPNADQLDTDNDSLGDACDNCTLKSNYDQRDSDGDGYGNMCDCDLNQDVTCDEADFTLFMSCFNAPTNGNSSCEAADMNGDGFVGGPDYTQFIGGFNRSPGPSAF